MQEVKWNTGRPTFAEETGTKLHTLVRQKWDFNLVQNLAIMKRTCMILLLCIENYLLFKIREL